MDCQLKIHRRQWLQSFKHKERLTYSERSIEVPDTKQWKSALEDSAIVERVRCQRPGGGEEGGWIVVVRIAVVVLVSLHSR